MSRLQCTFYGIIFLESFNTLKLSGVMQVLCKQTVAVFLLLIMLSFVDPWEL